MNSAGFVRQQLVEATVERVLLDQRKILAEQIAHGALLEPLPVQTPFAAGIDQPVADQRLRGCAASAVPSRRIGQTRRPEAVEFQLLVELAGEPARAPLPRPTQLHGPEPDLHAMALGVIGQRPIGGEQARIGWCVAPPRRRPRSPGAAASCWLSLISPRYSTWRCTTLPPAQRWFSTMLQ